jgi:hypothetical protein
MLALAADRPDRLLIAAGECDYAGGAAVIDEGVGQITRIPGPVSEVCGARAVASTDGLAMLIGRHVLSSGIDTSAVLPLIDVTRARVVRRIRFPLDPVDVLLPP